MAGVKFEHNSGSRPASVRAFRFVPRRETAAGRVLQRLLRLADRLDPSSRLTRSFIKGAAPPQVVVTCVFRSRHEKVLLEMMRGSGENVHWAFWALDSIPETLAQYTRGSGRGARMDLHAHLLETAFESGRATRGEAFWIITDDDLALPANSFSDLATVCGVSGFDVAAPCHAWYSHWSHRITLKRPLSIARVTHFVEIGPLAVLSPSAQRAVLPFPDVDPRGCGLESYWSSLHREELRCGLVDAITMEHLEPMGTDYNSGEAWAKADAFVRSSGWGDLESEQKAMMVTLGSWRPFHRRPPWAPDLGAAVG